MHHPSRIVLTALAATLLGCGSDPAGSGDTPNAALAFSPEMVAMHDSQPTAKIFLTTVPSGGRLSWQISSKPTWLTLNPSDGTVSGVSPVTLTATISAETEPGRLYGVLELVSSGGVASIPVSITVAAAPRLASSASTLTLAAAVDTQAVVLYNTGRGSLHWTAAASTAWLKVLPATGYIATGDSVTVRVVPNRDPLPAGNNSGTITFASHGTSTTVQLPVTVAVAPAPLALVRVSRLAFTGSGTRSFYLVNPGKGTLDWRVSVSDGWLATSLSTGEVAPSDSVELTVTADAARAPAVPATGGITITSNAVDTPTLGLSATLVASAPALGVRPLDYRVIAAEYSDAARLLLTVSADPARLNALDLETGESWSVALPKAPCCVSVRPDGRYAVVAHDAMLSYVDLATRTLVRTYSTTTDAIDVVLPMNGYAYVFPQTDQWVTIHGVDLSTGAESEGGMISAGTRAELHPGGEFMYGTRFVSPSDLEKYDIRARSKPKVVGDAPYHGDYPIGYNLWLSRDGARIFTEAGRVFRSSSAASEDMGYAGRLSDVEGARSISDSPSRNRIYALGTPSRIPYSGVPADVRTAELRSYDAATLAYQGAVTLPPISYGGQEFDADGYYVFADAAGSRVYVLLKAVPSSGLSKDWAILTLEASTLP